MLFMYSIRNHCICLCHRKRYPRWRYDYWYQGRVGFEAAAPLLIIKAHHLLEKHTLSKWQQQQKEQLSSFYGMHLHEGLI